MLAHYTSIETLQSMLKSNELWFSNPLRMNDLEELEFGLTKGIDAFRTSSHLRRVFDDEDYSKFQKSIDFLRLNYQRKNLIDTYVSCWSEQSGDDVNGRLSMWRGYGAQGSGAAVVIDTSRIELVEPSPLVIAKVRYGTEDERLRMAMNLAESFAQAVATARPSGGELVRAAGHAVDRIILFGLLTKHVGFEEEREWRVVYLVDHDPSGLLSDCLSYSVGSSGIETKLRFPFTPRAGVNADNVSWSNLVHRIILGPSHASELAQQSAHRMLTHLDKADLIPRTVASSIPLRA